MPRHGASADTSHAVSVPAQATGNPALGTGSCRTSSEAAALPRRSAVSNNASARCWASGPGTSRPSAGPDDTEQPKARITTLEQQVIDLELPFQDQGDDLAAARVANGELMAQRNRPNAPPGRCEDWTTGPVRT
jgi:hypothetical protein